MMSEDVTPRMRMRGISIFRDRIGTTPPVSELFVGEVVAEIYAEMDAARMPGIKAGVPTAPMVNLLIGHDTGNPMVQKFSVEMTMHQYVHARHPRWLITKTLARLFLDVMKDLWRKK